MAIEHVKQELLNFLSSTEPEVVCLKGLWGVGKTYAWNMYLDDAVQNGQMGLQKYSYVSLFGIATLEELRFSIFQNSHGLANPTRKNKLTDKGHNLFSKALQKGKQKAVPLLVKIPYAKSSTEILTQIASDFNIHKSIICLDDIERRSSKLAMRDVLGFVSNLRYQKYCKIILILNEDADDPEKMDWKKYYEKVVDKTLAFKPSASEAAEIAFPGESILANQIKKYCITLGIKNIRVLKRIGMYLSQVEAMLKDSSEFVMNQAACSIAVLSWCIYEPENAPPLSFLENRSVQRMIMSLNKSTVSEQETAWSKTLDSVDFYQLDDFDKTLLDGIHSGYFDYDALVRHAVPLEERAKAGASEKEIHDAWNLFHDSFDDNEEEVVEALFKANFKNAKYTHAMNVDGAIGQLKALGRQDLAKNLITAFIDSRNWNSKSSDFRSSTEYIRIKDEEFLEEINRKLDSIPDNRDPIEILLGMIKNNGWHPDDILRLADISPEDYYKLFKEYRNENLTSVIRRCLEFGSFTGPDERNTIIADNVKSALVRFGSESRLNEQRITKFGIRLKEKPLETD